MHLCFDFLKQKYGIWKYGGNAQMRNYLNSYRDRLVDSTLCELVELFKDKISWPDLPSGRGNRGNRGNSSKSGERRDRIFNQWRTFWIFLGQALSHSQSCTEALRKAQAWLWNKDKKKFHPIQRHSANLDIELNRNV